MLQVLQRGRWQPHRDIAPFSIIFRPVKSGMSNAEKKPHQRNPLVRAYCQISKILAFGEFVIQTRQLSFAGTSYHWYPRVKGNIHVSSFQGASSMTSPSLPE